MQTYIGDIISDCRRDTREDVDIPNATNLVGIQTKDFVRYANFAQQLLQGRITKKFPFVFEKKKEIALVADQAEYSIDDNLYMGTRIRKVEYSSTGEAKDYVRLRPSNPYSTIVTGGRPQLYSRSDGVITLEPYPTVSGGKIRVTFERALDRLAIRAGQITARTDTGTQITAITLNTTTDEAELLQEGSAQYLCVNDKYGTVKMYNIPITGYNPGTGAVTMSAFTYQAGESMAVGDYVTIGKYTTTHSKLVDDAERFIVEYINRRVFKRGSSSDALLIDQEMQEILADIVSSYEVPDKDVKDISIIDYEMLVWDDGYE